MNFNKIDELKQNDFKGFFSIQDLWNNKTVIPRIKGVYLVINPNYKDTEFISPGVGGFFKGKNPNISVSELKKNHILNSRVIYIGKAGSLTGKA